MTIKEAISLVDRLKPNQYESDLKLQWLSKLDGMIHQEIILTHVHSENAAEFAGYTANTGEDTELLVPYPYAEDVYNYYLQSMIDRENGESAKYNQSAAMYNAAFNQFQNWYNRNNRPLPYASHFLF